MISANRREWHLQLVNTRTKKAIDDDAGKFQVYQAGVAARVSIYDLANTQLTQEVVGSAFVSRTMLDGKLSFLTDYSVSEVDISVLTNGGRSYFLKGLKESNQRVDVDPDKQEHVLVAAFNDKASATTVRPLGFQLRKGMLIHDVRLKVTAAFAGAAAGSNRYSVGRSGNALGFLNNITMSAAGFKAADPSISTTGVVIPNRYGSLLSQFHASSTALVDFYLRKSYMAATAVNSNNLVVKRQTAATLTHSFTNSGVSGGGRAYIYYMYTLMPTEPAAATP